MSLAELRQLAMAATPGPWKTDPEYVGWVYDQKCRVVFTTKTVGRQQPNANTVADCEFIVALPPERIVALLDVIEAAKAMRDDANPPQVQAFDAALARLEREAPAQPQVDA